MLVTMETQLPAVVPVDQGGMIAALPRLNDVAEQSTDADELRTAGALAKGKKETAKALGIAGLHAELSWTETGPGGCSCPVAPDTG